MKKEVKVKVRRADKLVTEDAIYWVGEVPVEYRRGKNKKDKTRHGKRERQERLLEEALRPSRKDEPASRGHWGGN